MNAQKRTTYKPLIFVLIAAIILFLIPSISMAQDADATPRHVTWCWSESGGICYINGGESFYYSSSEITYTSTASHSGYTVDYYTLDGYSIGIDLINATFDVDRSVWNPVGSWIWNPFSEQWIPANDDTDTSGSVVGFREWNSSGDNIPDDWEYNTGYNAILVEFDALEPFEDDLYILIQDGYFE